MKAALIIVGILALVWFFYEVFTSKPILKEYLGVFIGGLGSGKTYLAHRRILEWYRREYRDYKWSCFFHPFNKKKRREKPYVYSNIPLRIGNRFNKRMSEVLTMTALQLRRTRLRPTEKILSIHRNSNLHFSPEERTVLPALPRSSKKIPFLVKESAHTCRASADRGEVFDGA